jgi:hypothetical protein
MIKAVLKSHGLLDIAKERSVEVHQSLDGANLSKCISHTTYGFKVADKSALCPFTSKPIFANPDLAVMQSRNLSFPTKIIMNRETKNLMKHFKAPFDASKILGSTDSNQVLPVLKPLRVAVNCNMSAAWKCLGMGGACKRDNNPCHCCAIRSDDLAAPNLVRCSLWCRESHDNKPESWCCYHHDFLSDENLEKMQSSLENISENLKELVPTMETVV